MNKILAALIAIAILPLPYAYYEVLRVIVSIGVTYLLITNWINLKEFQARLTAVIIIILFNPIYPIFLSKSWWVVIDIISAWIIYTLFKSETH